MPATIRPAFATLWNLDLALTDVVATTTEPALGAIRLAWWRERLEELDEDATPAEPRLRAISRQLLGRGIHGKELARLEDAWLPLFEPFPWGEAQAEGLKLRGRILFGIGARLLGEQAEEGAMAGEVWSLVDGARHCSDERSRIFLSGEAAHALIRLPGKIRRKLRPLTVLAAVAAYDVSRLGGFGRGGAALAHRLWGTFPRQLT
jgi:15-cis-phytoene synthase